MRNKVVLFDIDYTLFNTDLFREKVYPALAKKLHFTDTNDFHSLAKSIEQILKEKHGHFSAMEFLNELSLKVSVDSIPELEEIINDEQVYRASLFGNIEEMLSALEKNGVQIGILSTGNDVFQRQKIKHISHRLSHEDIHIFNNKIPEIKHVLAKYQGSAVYIVDDLPMVLSEAKKINNDVITILVKGKKQYEQTDELSGFTPDYVINEISEAKDIILNT